MNQNSQITKFYPPSPVKRYLLTVGKRYWPKGGEVLESLPLKEVGRRFSDDFVLVDLPDWAKDLGVGNPAGLLCDAACVAPGEGPAFERCDWWQTAFNFLSGMVERDIEKKCGPVHSYSRRLTSLDQQLFDYAWVNRIFMFLRRWAAIQIGQKEDDLFGPMPAPKIHLTHDVDAISKTIPVRLKQAILNGIGTANQISKGQIGPSLLAMSRTMTAALGAGNYWCFPVIRELEIQYGRRSTFLFYGGNPKQRPISRLLLDPSYDVQAPRLRREINDMVAGGWSVGLHQSYDSWSDPEAMIFEKERVENTFDGTITQCRQHWLKFSWAETWRAQEKAGLKWDCTLGFNDRPGFRTASALAYNPWDKESERPMMLESVPLILMDSHLYSRSLLNEEKRKQAIQRWLGEVKAVGGEASIVWHQRVMHSDYGWKDGYEEVLRQIP